ncbi:hypothetical protein ILUMI_25435 [Ignelater luminosus]|uniref:Ig-like domain-containing protein n=1 Tax=Ignelater luminosus TaxID=2038154 RepID=A0A8K0CBQ8_IGNLU|nr:hypothetical protein ILUMI_25435 [Ignelater luminosus]
MNLHVLIEIIVLWCTLSACIDMTHGINSEYETDQVHVSYTLEVVKGGVANIPCNISLHTSRDKVQTVVWYKGDIIRRQTSIYTFDARDKSLENGDHWSDAILGGRGSFRYQDEPPKLVLANVKESDAGIYICRVDYSKSPSQHYKVNLTVIIPPEKLIILDEKGAQINHYVIGPYNEGDLINVTCVAIGGRPQPNVTWWKENTLLDNIIEYHSKRRVKNTLHLHRLQRKDLHTVLTCQATNNNMAIPISSSVTLDMNLRPLWAKLWGKQRVLSAGKPYELSCEVVGSRPRPVITWWLGGVQMASTRELTGGSNNSTTSFLTYMPSIEDHRKQISCKGAHPFISDCEVEDGWILNIYHVPLNNLTLDSNIDEDDIREGTEVHFVCDIKANPWITTIGWHLNGEPIYNNPSSGVIVTNQSLILRNVNRIRSGNYTCVGSNLEGIGESNIVQLDVKYAPVCRPGQTKIHRVAIYNLAEIPCELEANPTNVQFTWKFKYNDGNTVKLPDHFITSEGTNSTVHYTPSSEDDFPALICSGRNEVGEIDDPCVFHLLPINSPEAPANCKVTKQTESSLHVECIDEFNRGIRGEFIMEVYDAQTGKLVRNVTSRDPTFTVRGLESGIGFDVDLYVANKDGKSLVTRLPTFTLSYEKLSDDSGALLSITTLLYILAGVVSALILVAATIVGVIRCRGDSESCDDTDFNGFEGSSGRYMPMGSDKFNRQTDSNTSYDSFDTESPDVIT